jgi:hypothetical protein
MATHDALFRRGSRAPLRKTSNRKGLFKKTDPPNPVGT